MILDVTQAQLSIWQSDATSKSTSTNCSPNEDAPSASPSGNDLSHVGLGLHILIADDNPSDVFVIREALKKWRVAAEVHVVDDGEKAIRFLDRADSDPSAPCPDLILLDIKMPCYNGAEIMRRLANSGRCSKSYVIAVTWSSSLRDRAEMVSLGVHRYFRKPVDLSEFMNLGKLVREVLGSSTR